MHIVFQEEDVKTLSKSFEQDETLRDEIFEIKDDFAVGPLSEIYSPEGIKNRKEWWRKVLSDGDYSHLVESDEVDDDKTWKEITEKLNNNEEETVWIWIAPNKHDVSGYYWLMSQLKEFIGRIYVLSLNNLPFINDKGNIFYPQNLFEIPPKEFLKAKKLARPITPSEFEIDPDEWTKICNENKMVRILEGAKKLVQHDEDFFDKFLLEFITPDWQKANKVIHQFLNKSKHITGDAYLLWRLKELILNDKIDAQGEIKNMKDFEVKRKINN
ncbi:MAG: DUF1835 domain-containing protein [Bacteroidota bacterium]|nr:DUF1835 domain-containing protein [Bacteroidota bacterium]